MVCVVHVFTWPKVPSGFLVCACLCVCALVGSWASPSWSVSFLSPTTGLQSDGPSFRRRTSFFPLGMRLANFPMHVRSTELRAEGRATTLPLDDGRRGASSGSPWSEKCVCVLGHVTCCCHIVKSEECVCVCVAVQPMYMHSRTSTHKRPRFHVLTLTRIRIRTCCVTDAHEVSTCTRGKAGSFSPLPISHKCLTE